MKEFKKYTKNDSQGRSKVILLCGMTGSGKTTKALSLENEHSAIRFSIDEWMISLYGKSMSRIDFDDRMEKIKALIMQLVNRLIINGTNVILDYGFWKAEDRKVIINQVIQQGGTPIIYFLNTPLSEIKRRLEFRNKNASELTFEITPEMLEDFMNIFQPPTCQENACIIEITAEIEFSNNLCCSN